MASDVAFAVVFEEAPELVFGAAFDVASAVVLEVAG
jgi:hypothetical protein